MADETTEQALKDRIAELEAQVAAAQAAPAAVGGPEFPRTMYRLGGKPGQVDHPGNEAVTVENQDEMQAKLDEGWSLLPVPVPDEPPAAPAVAEQPKRNGRR